MWTETGPIITGAHSKIKTNRTCSGPNLRGAEWCKKIKQDEIHIGENIRRVRLEKGIGQTELVRMLQLEGVEMTRETLVKIERGTQHIQAAQLRGLRDALGTSYDELLK